MFTFYLYTIKYFEKYTKYEKMVQVKVVAY